MNAMLITVGGLAVIVYLWATIMIYSFLKDRNENIRNFIFINFFIFKYLKDYKTITENETGKIGYLYYVWLYAIKIALLCFILLMAFGYKF